MIKLRIDNIEVEVQKGTSVMKAAETAGIEIPSMCFMEGYTNHPSCMVCLVKDKSSGDLFPSCAMPVAKGMEIITTDTEVKEARRESLELLLSDHVGDCEAPCRNGCPAFMNIPLMNRLIVSGDFEKAIRVVMEHIALPLVLGYICQAPCEKVCRRGPIDKPVSICQLKKYVAATDLKNIDRIVPEKEAKSGKNVAVIGGGPAGLSVAFYLTKLGHKTVVFDRNKEAGGTLLKLPESTLPQKELKRETDNIHNFGVKYIMNQEVDKTFFDSEIKDNFDVVVFASGANDNLFKDFKSANENLEVKINPGTFESGIPGVFACGSIIKKTDMAVKAVAQGRAAALAVNQYLQEKNPSKEHKYFNSKFGKLLPEEFEEYLKESIKDNRVEPIAGDLGGFSAEEAVQEAKRCMHCDCRKPHKCKLRIYSDEYGADRRKYLSGNRKIIKKHFNHDKIIYEPEKCIKCGLCVEITLKNKELTGLSFVGRGFDVEVNVPFSRSLDKALTKTALKCAEACPTGAISEKKI